jgi:hypothetical protein
VKPMKIDAIIEAVNRKLAGEMLTESQLIEFMDEVINDINTALSSCFPTISEFENDQAVYSDYPDYNFFPNKYIQNVLVVGTAYKFYINDEEGMPTAKQYGTDYQQNTYLMVRDYSALVPLIYQADFRGMLMNKHECLNITHMLI